MLGLKILYNSVNPYLTIITYPNNLYIFKRSNALDTEAVGESTFAVVREVGGAAVEKGGGDGDSLLLDEVGKILARIHPVEGPLVVAFSRSQVQENPSFSLCMYRNPNLIFYSKN